MATEVERVSPVEWRHIPCERCVACAPWVRRAFPIVEQMAAHLAEHPSVERVRVHHGIAGIALWVFWDSGDGWGGIDLAAIEERVAVRIGETGGPSVHHRTARRTTHSGQPSITSWSLFQAE